MSTTAKNQLIVAAKIALNELTEDSNAQGRLEAAGWLQDALDAVEKENAECATKIDITMGR